MALEKIQKETWLKPKKTHGKASKRLMTGAEAAKQAADRAEKAEARSMVHYKDDSNGRKAFWSLAHPRALLRANLREVPL
jgi:hypothetical protein